MNKLSQGAGIRYAHYAIEPLKLFECTIVRSWILYEQWRNFFAKLTLRLLVIGK